MALSKASVAALLGPVSVGAFTMVKSDTLAPHLALLVAEVQLRTTDFGPGKAIGSVVLGMACAGLLIVLLTLGGWLFTWLSSPKEQGPKETDPLNQKAGSWGPDGVCKPAKADDAEQVTDAKSSSMGLVATLLIALPSVIGSWCWPLLLVTIFGAGQNVASPGARIFSHHFSIGADAVLFGWLIGDVGLKTWRSTKFFPFAQKWGPWFVVTIGCLCTIVDVCRHVLLDHGGVFWPPQSLAMFGPDGALSTIGKTCQVLTIVGLCLLVLGVVWSIRVPEKIYGMAVKTA